MVPARYLYLIFQLCGKNNYSRGSAASTAGVPRC